MTLRDWLLVLLANSILVLGGIVLYDTCVTPAGLCSAWSIWQGLPREGRDLRQNHRQRQDDRGRAQQGGGGGAVLRQGAAGRAGEPVARVWLRRPDGQRGGLEDNGRFTT
jgi:hypothetical protein